MILYIQLFQFKNCVDLQGKKPEFQENEEKCLFVHEIYNLMCSAHRQNFAYKSHNYSHKPQKTHKREIIIIASSI